MQARGSRRESQAVDAFFTVEVPCAVLQQSRQAPLFSRSGGWGVWALLALVHGTNAAQKKITRIGVTKIVGTPHWTQPTRLCGPGQCRLQGRRQRRLRPAERTGGHGTRRSHCAPVRHRPGGSIHTIATPTTQAVLKTRTDIPVVFSGITHPIQAGIVPRGSVSGARRATTSPA
jgi:ABC-type uncharacterized transport system substrate-binding protein